MTKILKKIRFRLPLLWNSFFKVIFLFYGCLLGIQAGNSLNAVTISAVYSSACVRETGVIINVDDSTLQLMSLKGEIRSIPRFDIIYLANYPVGSIQMPRVANPEVSTIVTVKTIFENRVVDLVKGWMIDHSEEQISFLTMSGTQSVIDTEDIWDIDITPFEAQPEGLETKAVPFKFVHPYPFMHCETTTDSAQTPGTEVRQVYPQSLLSEPLLIKRELDRLKEGYDKIRAYDDNKRFYPVPQIYGNDTSLGVWANVGNRYGSSKNRSNSFIPSIVSETADGPFGYQSIFVTGSAPMFYGIHEEPQMQAYFRMKASYVHFSIMLDFSRFTMGAEKYKWSKEDLETNDNRENETLHLAGGFDYGPFAIDLSVVNYLFYAVRHESEFHQDDMVLNRGSVSYHDRTLKAELHYGFGSDTKEPLLQLPDDASGPDKAYIEAYNEKLRAKSDFQADFLYWRFTLNLFIFDKLRPTYSLIYKGMDFVRQQNAKGLKEFKYTGKSLTNALHISYPISAELHVSGYLSWEQMEKEYGITDLDDKSTHSYPKGGVSLALLF